MMAIAPQSKQLAKQVEADKNQNSNSMSTQQHAGQNIHDDTQSQYSGNSGMAPSLVSHTINYFPQGGRTEDDN